MSVLIPFIIILLLVLLNGLFVAAEFAIIGVRPSRVEQLAEEGNRTAVGLREVVQAPAKVDRYIASAQLGITLASLGLGMYAEPQIAHLIEAPLHDYFHMEGDIVHTIAFLIALTFITYLHVVIGEMVPKSIALQNAERTVLLLNPPMRLMQWLFSYAITGLNQIGLFFLWLLRVPPPTKHSRLHTPEDLELIVADSLIGGMLEPEEHRLVNNIFDFAERRVGQVMTPRTKIDALPVNISEKNLLEHVCDSPHSRFPVYEDNLDNIVGVLHLKDLVRQQLEGKAFDLRKMLHHAPKVPESMEAETLLNLLRQLHTHMAIVVDEYEGTAGLVTLEDLVEEVVGEVHDEFDEDEESAITVVEDGHLLLQGDVLLDDLEEYVELPEHDHDVETIGGLVIAFLNRPPQVGDEASLEDVTFKVEAVDGLSIEKLRLRFPPKPKETVETT